MIRVKSLQQRFVLLLLLPVAGLLVGMGIVGFIYARTSLLTQWQEAAILKLERAGKDVDMRLSRFKEWLEMYYKTGGEHHEEHVQQWILDQLKYYLITLPAPSLKKSAHIGSLAGMLDTVIQYTDYSYTNGG